MAHRRCVSSTSSELDLSSSSSLRTSPTPPLEISCSSTEPLKGIKRKRKLSGSDDDKSSKRLRSQKEDNEEPNDPDHTQDLAETHLSGVQPIITAIRATDLALGLRRIPAGFHAVIKADDLEYQTSNISVNVDQAVVEWHERIPLPREPCSKVRVSLYASFELGPMLCHGELLRTFEISVGELMDRSEKLHPIIFQPKQQEVVSACTSLFLTVEQQLSDQNDAAVLCPPTTPASRDLDALALRTDAGHRLLAQYRRAQDSRDLEQSINHFEHASDICPVDHPCRPAALFNLASAKLVSCQAEGRYLDLDVPVSLFEGALELRPTGHPDRTVTQLHLAVALLSRFAKRGFQTDADAAKEFLGEVVNVCHANSHIHRAAAIAMETCALHSARGINANDVGQERPAPSRLPLSPNQLFDQARRCLERDEPSALDEVISLHYDALGYYNAGHVCRGQLLGNLAVMLQTRFERRGNDKDLDQGIALQTEMLALCPVGHTDRSASLNNLANKLSSRFHHRGNDEDLDQAIALNREALALRPVGHTDRSMSLSNLALQLSSRFHHRGNGEDLDEAIALNREALALRPVGHTDRSASLNNLANRLSSRFHHRGNGEDLDQAIALHREALALCPVGHTRSKSLNNLANQLSSRFDTEQRRRLGSGYRTEQGSPGFVPVGHADRSISLNNLALQLSSRFDHRGNGEDLDQAIALNREALALRPVGHADRSMSLNNLATRLSYRFDHRGNGEDLDQAIAFQRQALALCPVGHTDRSASLNNLANLLSSRFDHRGNDEDLDQAIALNREALALLPVGHADRSKSLSNLANRLSSRFDHRANGEDLDEAIALNREALALRPVGHTDRSASLNNLANLLSSRFHHRGNGEDLDQAIALHREALALCPVGHTHRSKSLNNLANQLSYRFDHRANGEDLDQAIALQREALALRPVGHTDRSMSLYSLANLLPSRFDLRHDRKDLDESRENLLCALTLLTQHDPRRSMVHQSIANVYLSFHRSELDGTGAGSNTDSLNAAMHHFKAATNIVPASLLSRLRASLSWVHHARQHSHGTQLEAYMTSMQLLDAYMSVTASISSRHNAMKGFPSTLAVDAASCALRSGDVGRAVELLEQGRTIIWTQMTRLRMPLDGLQTRGDHAATLMKTFTDLSSLLDKPHPSHPEGTPTVDVEAEATRYRRIVKDWNGTVEEIRKIEGFSRFLLPPLFSDLQDAARDGPIIMLIASESSCDAIIIPHKQPPTSIQLPTDIQKLVKLVNTFRESVEKETGHALMEALNDLWNNVVGPVVEKLGKLVRLGSRIWWCPTFLFNFLPLHAAREYRTGGMSLSQLYISSYTPSLTALIKARASRDRPTSVPFVAIGQNRPAGVSFTLDAVEPELELVRKLLPPPPTVSFSKITSVDATKSRALCALRENTWFHLACHGTQRFDEPFKSAFLMRDQPLSLLDIAQMDLSQHNFAFLSACETAVGDFSTPDEVIHLAAGLQFAGVRSVVGTLWKVNDDTVQRLVKAFYEKFCEGGPMNPRRAARALHRAVQSLASDVDIPLAQRIVFVHIGI
ncbi:CHAT domain-containing protein [Suillus bovinus]|uniref:CHAT domain-containing protein n=1 Tax=Suillus bovinus TaxID=48563 RepID=UPI001B87BC76|nr:CHAT domain-containing protein [Suillus bovinus]KAG2150205.1 CHAT domain-containing protein [Suillus bovinus]